MFNVANVPLNKNRMKTRQSTLPTSTRHRS